MSSYASLPMADVTHEAAFEPLLADSLDRVLHVEQRAYSHPWSRANFIDALHSGYQAQMLTANGQLLGYFVAMKGVDEVHLLACCWTHWPSGRGARVRSGCGWKCG